MLIDYITQYLLLFFMTAFSIYFTYCMFIFPLYNKIPVYIAGLYNSAIQDYAVLMVILSIFSIVNKFYTKISYSLFLAIDVTVIVSVLLLLSSSAAFIVSRLAGNTLMFRAGVYIVINIVLFGIMCFYGLNNLHVML